MSGYAPELLERLLKGDDLPRLEMREVFAGLMGGEWEPAQIAALLVALRAKGETVDEVAGAAEAMRQAAVAVPAPAGAMDLCGTGGDRSGTINVSTAAALVVAAAGVPVAKHGNRSVSSKSGSADVLEAMGVPTERGPEEAAADLEEHGFAFLFAPLYHPAMKHAIGPRRQLGVRTIFNLLGPLTNPAGVRRQLMGVFSKFWVEPLAHVLGRLGAERAMVVHSEDGLDELSLSAETSIAEWVDGEVRTSRLTPEELGFRPASMDDLMGGSAEVNAEIILGALTETGGPVSDWIALNAAGALRVARDLAWTDAVELSRETMASGAPRELIERLRGLVPAR